jgi:hypothetical protein
VPDAIEEELPDGDTFDRAYVEKIREEAAKYRTTLRPFQDAFGDFNPSETEYLFGMLKELNGDPQAGALMFRDMAKNILSDKFYDGLDDAPQTTDSVEDADPQTTTEGEDQVSDAATPQQIKAMLDERDKVAQEAAAASAQTASDEADIEAVFKDIEAAGFERGTEAFQTALSLGSSMAASGQEVDFAVLAPKVRVFHDIAEPAAEGEAADPVTEVVEGSGKEHALTAGAGGAGAGAEAPKGVVELAAEKGIPPLEMARELMEARLEAS